MCAASACHVLAWHRALARHRCVQTVRGQYRGSARVSLRRRDGMVAIAGNRAQGVLICANWSSSVWCSLPRCLSLARPPVLPPPGVEATAMVMPRRFMVTATGRFIGPRSLTAASIGARAFGAMAAGGIVAGAGEAGGGGAGGWGGGAGGGGAWWGPPPITPA